MKKTTVPNCPFCGRKQAKEPQKKWSYGIIEVERYLCMCNKKFNFYQSTKKTWTIPKHQ